ncbi:hypothetical protein BTO30_09420 [Domibacillus antri]|uniref:Uncharacterized protein n=1 Tax=Domibacillus antri TaxID=1714264 RepID=A0A1Q8Q587_9BACI|nr:hypothetical protein [Domibacillus antri]OLN22514.1 hypothetical protein BTO30_09420 [Domibacillus antri]
MKTVFAELVYDEAKIPADLQSLLKEALRGHGIEVSALTDHQPIRTDAPSEGGSDKKGGVQVQSDILSAGAGGMVSPQKR